MHILMLCEFYLDENLKKQTCDPFLDGVCHLVRETNIDKHYLYYSINKYEVTSYFTTLAVFSLYVSTSQTPGVTLVTTAHYISCCSKMDTNILSVSVDIFLILPVPSLLTLAADYHFLVLMASLLSS